MRPDMKWRTAVLGLIVVLFPACSRPRAQGPLEVTLWYWHAPFQVSATETRELEAMGIRRLFVRAGTLSEAEGHMSLVTPQSFRTGPDSLSLVLVFNLDYVFVRGYDEVDNRLVSETLVKGYETQKLRAQAAGLRVKGLQIDFDCPTSKLEKYGELLKLLRAKVPKGESLSITALPTWLSNPHFERILGPLDFYVPQFYEGSMGTDYGHIAPISNVDRLREGLNRCSQIDKPFLAGLPAYGQSLLYDAQGRMSGTYRDLSPTQACRHPGLGLDQAYPADSTMNPASQDTWIGEQLLSFVATKADAQGRGLGYRIVYKLPTATLLRKGYEAVVEDRPANCLGIAIFRFPEAEETMTVPMPSVSAVIRGETLTSHLELSVQAKSEPWELVERPGSPGRLPSVVRLALKNTGNEGTAVGPRSIRVEASFDKPGVEATAGQFDTVFARSAQGERTVLTKASTFMFNASWLAPGQTITTGPIRIGPLGPDSMTVRWTWLRSGGFQQGSGELSVKSLAQFIREHPETSSHGR